MSIKLNLGLLLLLVIGCVMGGAIFSKVLTTSTAQAQQVTGVKVPNYEYCFINQAWAVRDGDKVKGGARICLFRASGLECQVVESEVSYDSKYAGSSLDKTRNDAVAKAVAKLGNEGWEMTGQGYPYLRSDTQDAVYFKRQR